MEYELYRNSSILIVDDNPQNLQVLGKMLTDESFNLEFAIDGKSALNWISIKSFDIILLDIMMPGMNGIEVCKKIRKMDNGKNIPIIFLSADSDKETILAGFEAGGQDYVTKPFDYSELLARVKTHLMLKNSIAELEKLTQTLEAKVQERTSELKIAKEKAEEGDRLKTSFIHNISHEIRTPLNAIVGLTSIMMDNGGDQDKFKEYGIIINNSAQQLCDIIDDIFSISSIETEQVPVRKEEISINEMVSFVYDQFKLKAEDKKLAISLNTSLSDEDSVIITDKTKLIEILSNLVGNALKFTLEGKIDFGYILKGDMVEFYITDTGIGIPTELHEDIFKRFRQVETTDIKQFSGIGLGLSISKAYVELLGGRIWLASQPGKGSTFYFTIPYQKVNPKIADDIIPERVNLQITETKTILIAEDDDNSYILLKEIFDNSNIKILRAFDGVESVDLCTDKKDIDLVLMDIKMPGMDGYEATKQIKKIRPDLPVIIQTAYAFDSDKEKISKSGCDDFINKPFVASQVLMKVSAYFK